LSILSTIAIIILIIVVIGAIAVLGNNNKSTTPNQAQLPQFQNTGGTVPAAFSSILSQPSLEATQSLAALSAGYLSSTTRFSVSYKGVLYIQPSGAIGAIASVSSPLYMNESKYGASTKLSLNATSIPILGNGRLVYAALANGTFTCTNFNASDLSASNITKLLSISHGMSCIRSGTLAGVNISSIAKFNLSSLSSLGALNYTKDYQSTYKGSPCTYIAGNMVQTTSNGITTGTGEFGECMSDTYYVPLSFAISFSGSSGSASIDLNETSIGNYSNSSYVNSLPGPAAQIKT
jgi:hypothetical protein